MPAAAHCAAPQLSFLGADDVVHVARGQRTACRHRRVQLGEAGESERLHKTRRQEQGRKKRTLCDETFRAKWLLVRKDTPVFQEELWVVASIPVTYQISFRMIPSCWLRSKFIICFVTIGISSGSQPASKVLHFTFLEDVTSFLEEDDNSSVIS